MENDKSSLDLFLEQNKWPLLIGAVGLVLLIGGIITSGIIPKTFLKSSKTISNQSILKAKQTSIKIDIAGEVVKPGVYELPPESRIKDVIDAAGGVTQFADQAFLSKTINLAQKVSDGTKIYVPKQNEIVTNTNNMAVAGVSQTTQTTLININTASLSELDKLPGIGPVSAQNIIERRPYAGIEELLTKKAVTRSTYDKIKTLVSVY